MKISDVIQQLRTYAPIFGGNVAGGVGFQNGISDQVWLPTPAAYVVPGQIEATENANQTGLRQVVSWYFGVIVQLDNATDRRSQASAERIDEFLIAINKALLNWHIEPRRSAKGIELVDGEYKDSDRARFFYQYNYCFKENLDQTDGFQITGTPLTGFQKTYTDAATDRVLVVQNVIPPTTI